MEKLNFIQSISVKEHQSINRWLIVSGIIGALCAIIVAAIHTYYTDQFTQLNAEKSALQEQIKKLEPAITEKNTLIEQEQTTRKQVQMRASIADIQENPGIYLQEIGRLIPAHALIDSLTREAKKTILIRGSAKNAQAVTQFLENLNDSKYFNTMKLKFIEPTGCDIALRFMIEGKLVVPQKQFIESLPEAPKKYSILSH
ncbi:MAG: PilN domain-containing protein [Candidatus Babeliales bacterium]